MFKKRIHLVNHLFPQIGKREYNKIMNNGSPFFCWWEEWRGWVLSFELTLTMKKSANKQGSTNKNTFCKYSVLIFLHRLI